MSQLTKNILIIFSVLIVLTSLFAFVDGFEIKRVFANYGLGFIVTMPITLIIGIILSCIKTKRQVGFAFLLVAAISLLIGVGLCSQSNGII